MIGNRPVIAVPMGDPAGIGPEIVLRAAMSEEVSSKCCFIVIGDERILRRALTFPHMPAVEIRVIEKPEEGIYRAGVLNVIDLCNLAPEDYELGTVSARCGRAAYEYIERSIQMAMDGTVDAVSTTPINKEALHAAEIPYIGHTEIFGALTNTPDPLTIFEVKNTMASVLSRSNLSLSINRSLVNVFLRRTTEIFTEGAVEAAAIGKANL